MIFINDFASFDFKQVVFHEEGQCFLFTDIAFVKIFNEGFF